MKAKKVGNSMLLMLAALIWGVAFVAQSIGMDHIGPYTFNAARFIIGGIVLLPVVFLFSRKTEKRQSIKAGIIGGLCCGACLSVASTLQQVGILHSDSVGKVGFITSLYIILVPLLGIFLRKRVTLNVWISVGIAAVGMYLLCITDSFSLHLGDGLVLLCAIVFSVHILLIDHFSPKADGILISCIQFFVAGIFCTVLTFLFEQPTVENLLEAKVPVLYTGILSSGVAFTLQVIAQKNIEPTIASLIMSLESVFALIAGVIILEQMMSGKELVGCVFVFAAIILAQIPFKMIKRKNRLFK